MVRGRATGGWCGAALALATAWVGAGCADVDVSTDQSLLLRPDGDVLVVGNTLVVSDSVSGDVMTAGGSALFDGVAGGSYLGAGGDLVVRGRVDGSVRVGAGNVVLSAQVGRNVTMAGGNVEVRAPGVVGRNAYLAGGRVLMAGSVGGDLYAGAGEVVIDGSVAGDVRVEAERLRLGPDARIGGELRYRVVEGGLSMDPAASVDGGVEALAPRESDPADGTLFFALRILAFLLCGAVVVALLPGTTGAMSEAVPARPAAAAGLGLLWVLLVPIAAILAAVTVVGLPLAVILIVLYAMSLYLAPVVTAVWVGSELLPGAATPDRPGRLKAFLAGGLIVGFAILLPWVGWVARLAAVLLGLGAVTMTVSARWSRAEAGASQEAAR